MDTQWRHAGSMGSRVGLDYGVIETTARLLEHEPSRGLFDRLRLLEEEALQELARRQR